MKNVLKYPGSKWRLAPKLVALIPDHHSYVEPYFGSGAVLFTKQPSDIETVNDLDSDVANLFSCIRKDSQHLSRLIVATPFSREIYESIWTDDHIDEPYEKALSFRIKCWQGHGFRTNDSKVGWKNDVQGRESAYALRNWYRLPAWLDEIADRLRMVQIENRPALEVIDRFNHENVFMYIDPPYVLKTRAGKQYRHEMTDADHVQLLETLLKSHAKIMISGYNSDMYNNMLSGWYRDEFSSTAEHGKKREEIVWRNFKVTHQMSFFDQKI